MTKARFLKPGHVIKTFKRYAGKEECGEGSRKKGLVLGVYDGCHPGESKLTSITKNFNDRVEGKVVNLIKGFDIKKGTVKVFGNVMPDFYNVAVVGLGQEGVGVNELEHLDECKENIRIGAGVGCLALQEQGVSSIFVEGFTNTEAAAEGATLSVWAYQDNKDPERRIPTPLLDLYEDPNREGWQAGTLKANAQNLARRLEEIPANMMTPMIFAKHAVDALCPCGVQVEVRERDFIENKKMNAFLAVTKGSCEPPTLLEIGYCGADPEDHPVVFVAKGVTFDTGGLCLKKCQGMSEYRGDVAGAAVIVGAIKAIASMALPLNVKAIIPVCENMIGGMAMKPGDVVKTRNDKTIRIDDTSGEGRLMLADAIVYAGDFLPCLLMSIGTLTIGMRRSIGTSASGVFTTAEKVWRELDRAGSETGDRVWRLPMWKYYRSLLESPSVDVKNVCEDPCLGGGPCVAAAFLNEFIPKTDFVHLDITGSGMVSNGIGMPYMREGVMSGRPVRTLAQFLWQMACPHDKGDEC